MTLVNLTGLSLLGPGSEWLWAMLQFLVLLITGAAIYRQLRAQGSANALSSQTSLVTQWESPEMVRLRVEALIALSSRPAEPPEALSLVGNFFATMAALRTHGHVRPGDAWEVWSGEIQFWWALAEPYVGAWRHVNPGVYGEFEELARTMAAIDAEKRVPNFVATDLEGRTERQIARLLLRLRIARDIQRGTVPEVPELPAPDGQR